MAKAKVQTLATEQPRVNLAGTTQKALERCGLNRGLSRCQSVIAVTNFGVGIFYTRSRRK